MKSLFYPLIIIFFLLNGCQEKDIEERFPKKLPSIVIENFSITETKKGKKLWSLHGVQAYVFENVVKADTVEIKFFDEDEELFSILTALRGVLNTKSHNVQVEDSVKLCTNDSTKLFTKSLFWNNDSGQIFTNEHIKIIKNDGTIIEGNGLRADPGLKKIEIIGSTKGVSPIELPDINR